jgi:hypothetical protein
MLQEQQELQGPTGTLYHAACARTTQADAIRYYFSVPLRSKILRKTLEISVIRLDAPKTQFSRNFSAGWCGTGENYVLLSEFLSGYRT